MALYLHKGSVIFRVNYGTDEHDRFTQSNTTINDGKTYTIDVTLNYQSYGSSGKQQYTLIVKHSDKRDDTQSDSFDLQSKNLFRIKKAQRYIGGVPPTFDRNCVPFEIKSFMGHFYMEVPLTNLNSSYGTYPLRDKVRITF